jgi:Na+(H+)/acetate symporter ActP
VLVVAIGWLYLLPQFQGAGLTLATAIDAPEWVGAAVVGAVVVVIVGSGGMRSITFVQAFQYWLKLSALLIPAAILLVVWVGDGSPHPSGGGAGWSMPLGAGNQGLYTTYSIVLATFLGTMGLPHVVVRFYTNPDGRAARRTTLVVLALLGTYYLLPPVYAALGRAYGADADDTVVLELPRLMLDGLGGDLLTGVVSAGAFAAFISTSSGLAIAVSGVLAQDVLGGRYSGVTAFRVGAVVAVSFPLAAALLAPDLSVARAVGLAFAVAASTFCPLLVLGIWWRGLTAAGAVTGLLVGGLGSTAGVAWTLYDGVPESWRDVLLGQPAAWSVPLAFAAMVGVSLLRPDSDSGRARRFMVRLHTPEVVPLDRG